ncbi:MAG: ABC transporter substrate-binding protein [Candidatus Heimdallarchaeaceae archaeon]
MKKRKIVLFTIVFLIFTPYLVAGQETKIPIYFSINLLSPNDDVFRNQFSIVIQETLPKIGIGVGIHESTTWDYISPRAWLYPLYDYDYIPTYAQGGYDALFLKRSWDLDWDPDNIFSAACLSWPLNNIYQYVNPAYEAKLTQYLIELDQPTRIGYVKEIQAMLYEDLPAISIVYPRLLYGFKENIIGIDSLLLSLSKFRAENWDDPEDHIINYAIPESMNATNAFDSSSFFDNQWMTAVYGPLFLRIQDSHEWKPVIASNYSLSSDRKNYTVQLDSNARFSDGSPILAEDVKYTYNLHMTPEVNSEHYSYFSKWFASNDSIEILDSQTLNFNLSKVPVFSQKLLSYGIVDKSSVEPAISTYGYSIFDEIPLTGNVQDVLVKSCGPFMLENFSSSEVRLVPNPYWNELNCSGGNDPILNELNFRYISSKDEAFSDLEAGAVDILDGNFGIKPIATFEDISGVRGEFVKVLQYQELAMNLVHPVFGTGELTPVGTPTAAKCVRKAISHAIPRQIIVDQIYEGLAKLGVTPMPDGCIGFDESLEPYAFNLDLAIDYMNDAGFAELWHGNGPTPASGFTSSVMLFVLIGLAYAIFIRRGQ